MPDTLYHTHWSIPGIAFSDFLVQIVHFLDSNVNEIGVVQSRFDDITSSRARATMEELSTALGTALGKSTTALKQDGFCDIETATSRIEGLRFCGKHLVILDTDASQFSTYSETVSASLHGKTIVNAFRASFEQSKKEILGATSSSYGNVRRQPQIEAK
nr:hypothetical protein CFP56_00438 [Quercus suber]